MKILIANYLEQGVIVIPVSDIKEITLNDYEIKEGEFVQACYIKTFSGGCYICKPDMDSYIQQWDKGLG